MHFIARGLYRELLDEQWSEGSIPNELSELAEICGCSVAVVQEHWEEIRTYFQERPDGRLVNKKMETQRTAQDLTRVQLADSGRRGGIAKLHKLNDEEAGAKPSQAEAKPLPYSRALAEQEQEHKQEHPAEPIFEKDTDMNALTEIKKICNLTLGLDPHIWDSDKKKLREYSTVHGGTAVGRMFQEWAEANVGGTSNNPITDFLRIAPGLFNGTFSPSADKAVINITREMTFLSGNTVLFNDKQKTTLAKLLSDYTEPEVIGAFREFFQKMDTNDDKKMGYAAKDFVEGADASCYTRRKQQHVRLSEQAAADRAREVMVAESVSDREERRKAKEAEEALIEDVLE
jgi:hypothetical protein